MAKTPWQVLGLSGPTADKKAIKRAYAQQVKLYHPEDHPEEFQALQAAYQEALKRATELAAQESRGDRADFAGGRDPRPASQPADFGKPAKIQPSDPGPGQVADQKPGKSADQKPGQTAGPSGQTQSQWQAPQQTEPKSETNLDWSDVNQRPEDSIGSQSLSWSAPQDQEPASDGHLSWQDQAEEGRQNGSLSWQDQAEEGRQSGSLNWQDSKSDSSLGDLDELEADDPIFSELEEPEQDLFRQEELEDDQEVADYQPSVDFNLDYQVDIKQLLAPLRGFLDDQDLEGLMTNQALMAQIGQHGQKEELDLALTRLVLTQNRRKRKRVKQLAQQYGLTHLLKKSKQGFRLPYWPMWRLVLAGLAFLLAALFGRFTGSGPSHPIPPRKPAVDVGKLAVISYDPISIPSFSLDLSGLDQMGESGRLEGPEGNQSLWIGEEERLTGIKQAWSLTRSATLYQTQSGYALHLRAKDKLIDFKDYQAMRQVTAFNDQGTQKTALIGQDKSSQQWYLVDLSSGRVLAAISGTAPEQGDTSMGVHYSQQGDLVKAKWERLPQ